MTQPAIPFINLPAERREAVDAMRALSLIKGVPDAEVDDWINEGRR
ncbi:hypothetical protein [Spiribacter vilamensis]|uniref:Uncharacterized protein n=1 Tax=Spiribacter vilamensis TaxID=531306 RepID=A0A4V2GJ67_9GAMM|nr:hypothetical protein [Spiribacter vilamensis]RZU99115.1 hypothetical protein EV698_1395 [Spiribacter vilamensis]